MPTTARAMIPRRTGSPPRQKRDDKDPKRTFAVRLGGEIRDWVEQADEAGVGTTSIIIKALETAMGLSSELGNLWWEVERRARVDGVNEGVVIGRLLKSALEPKKK